jgi:anti-sigma-K factor RskA
MTHEELRNMYEFYALGLLEPEERAEIEEHLSQGCETCRSGLRQAVATNSAILSFVPDVAPPKRLRARVLAGFGNPKQNWTWMAGWAAATAGLLIAVLWFSTDAQRTRSELAVARERLAHSSSELTRVQTVLDFLNSPDTRQVTFGKSEQQPPRGTVLVNPKNGVLLVASNLPTLPSDKTYEMWLIPKGGAPKPAGLFRADEKGAAIHVIPGPVDPTTGAVAVSVEPQAGSSAPTSTPIVVAAVAALTGL